MNMNGFIANLYEFFGAAHLGEFTENMWNENFYRDIFIIMLVSVMSISFIYYYIVNHPRLNRWYHWLFVNLGTSLLNFVIVWIVTSDNMVAFYFEAKQKIPPLVDNWTNYFTLGSIAFFWTFVFFFIFSFIIKWGSRNCKHVPFI